LIRFIQLSLKIIFFSRSVGFHGRNPFLTEVNGEKDILLSSLEHRRNQCLRMLLTKTKGMKGEKQSVATLQFLSQKITVLHLVFVPA